MTAVKSESVRYKEVTASAAALEDAATKVRTDIARFKNGFDELCQAVEAALERKDYRGAHDALEKLYLEASMPATLTFSKIALQNALAQRVAAQQAAAKSSS